ADIAAGPRRTAPVEPAAPAESPATSLLPLIAPEARAGIQRIMSEGAGVLRSARSLGKAGEALETIFQRALHPDTARSQDVAQPQDVGLDGKPAVPGVESWETSNLLCVARVLVATALEREETRGSHWREDRPERDDSDWRRHLVVRLLPDRGLAVGRTETAAFPPVGPHLPPAQPSTSHIPPTPPGSRKP
ncbi:L-aspartate oxidase, partial [Streptomyces sp. SID4917]